MRVLPLLLVLLCAGCTVDLGGETIRGSGTAAEEQRAIEGTFREVAFSIPGTLVIEPGAAPSLRIEADDNLLEHIRTEVDGPRLEIGAVDGANLGPEVPLRVHLTVETLEAIRVAGSGDVEAPGLETPRLAVSVAGSGDVRVLDLQAEAFVVEAAGSGDIEASGRVQRQQISLAGSGDVEARELVSDEAEVSIAGSGSAELNVRTRLDASILGSGSVRYLGNPEIERSVMGSGDVEPLDD